MTPRTGLVTALVAAVVAALVTVAGLALAGRFGPGSGATDQASVDAAVRDYFAKNPDADAGGVDDMRVEEIVRDYLTKNPEILVAMTTELDKRQQDDLAAKQRKIISENADALFRSPNSHTAGNPNGDVTVVEFFDYNCGYCRRALPDLVKLMESDSQVRVVLKELPIFGEDSEAAAKGALAANKQGKYFEMHQKLFNEPGKADKEKVLRVGKELNLDVEKLEKDMDDPIVKAELDEARELAQKLELQGTPFYLIGDRTIPGAPEDLHDQLVDKVKEVREKGCDATC
jgi:protein-disulfide isomerase